MRSLKESRTFPASPPQFGSEVPRSLSMPSLEQYQRPPVFMRLRPLTGFHACLGGRMAEHRGCNQLVEIAMGASSFSCRRLELYQRRSFRCYDRLVTSISDWDRKPLATTPTVSQSPPRHPLRRPSQVRHVLAIQPFLLRPLESSYTSDTSITRVSKNAEKRIWSVHPLLLRPTTSRRRTFGLPWVHLR